MAILFEALALGFSTGSWCAMYCAPVLLPFLLGREDLSHKKNAGLIGLFLGGRLITYIALALGLGFAGLLASGIFDPIWTRRLSSVAYILSGLLLLLHALAPRLLRQKRCERGKEDSEKEIKSLWNFWGNDNYLAFFSGLSVGLHICPPLWTASFRVIHLQTPLLGALYFFCFYLGTLPFFTPLLGIPFISKRIQALRRIARITQAIVGVYFFIAMGLVSFFFEG